MVTIKEIAAMAGVSPSTVANVLHGRTEKVSKATFEKVRMLLAETNYTSNMAARILGNYDSRIIGVIVTWARRDEQNIAQDPFFAEIIGKLEQNIRESGYYMMLYTSASVDEALKMAASWNIEGLIVLGCLADDCAAFVKGTNMPIVFIDAYFHDDGLTYGNVGFQDFRGAFMMTEYLVSQGHKRMAFLADGAPPMGADFERLKGFKASLQKNDLAFQAGDYIPISHRREERHALLRSLLKGRLMGFSALFFSSDFYAVDAMNLLQDEGVKVPGEMSVCGFDDNILAIQSRPKLTTVRQDVSKKASLATDLLIRQIKGKRVDSLEIQLEASLSIRESIGRVL
ncbi:MAG: LacI family transcriptional regulator [Clostridiales bacterium]|jgi:LacI family transcriptional regulator|nr:LacI family transcriptional regulator [Clostridiales bacterium]